MSEIAIRLLPDDEFALTYTDPLGRVVVFGVGEMVEPTVAELPGGVGCGESLNLDSADSHPSNLSMESIMESASMPNPRIDLSKWRW